MNQSSSSPTQAQPRIISHSYLFNQTHEPFQHNLSKQNWTTLPNYHLNKSSNCTELNTLLKELELEVLPIVILSLSSAHLCKSIPDNNMIVANSNVNDGRKEKEKANCLWTSFILTPYFFYYYYYHVIDLKNLWEKKIMSIS